MVDVRGERPTLGRTALLPAGGPECIVWIFHMGCGSCSPWVAFGERPGGAGSGSGRGSRETTLAQGRRRQATNDLDLSFEQPRDLGV